MMLQIFVNLVFKIVINVKIINFVQFVLMNILKIKELVLNV